MNRIVLIGNGFDIAHGLKTRYEDFLIWYIKQKLDNLICQDITENEDCLCTISRQESISLYPTDSLFIPRKNFEDLCSSLNLSKYIEIENFCKNSLGIDFYKEPFFQNITNSVATKGWVDIENEYYHVLTDYVGDELEILDPYGGSLQSYGLCYETLRKTIKKLVKILN